MKIINSSRILTNVCINYPNYFRVVNYKSITVNLDEKRFLSKYLTVYSTIQLVSEIAKFGHLPTISSNSKKPETPQIR